MFNQDVAYKDYWKNWDHHDDRMFGNQNSPCNNFGGFASGEREKRKWAGGDGKRYPFPLPRFCSEGVKDKFPCSSNCNTENGNWYESPDAHSLNHGYHLGTTMLNFDGNTMFDYIDHDWSKHVGPDLIVVDACTGKMTSKIHITYGILFTIGPKPIYLPRYAWKS